MNTYVPIFRDLDARGGRKLRTDTHTNTRDNYSNPRCAHARRGLIIYTVAYNHYIVEIQYRIARAHNKTGEEEERVTPIDACTHGQNISRVLKIAPACGAPIELWTCTVSCALYRGRWLV